MSSFLSSLRFIPNRELCDEPAFHCSRLPSPSFLEINLPLLWLIFLHHYSSWFSTFWFSEYTIILFALPSFFTWKGNRGINFELRSYEVMIVRREERERERGSKMRNRNCNSGKSSWKENENLFRRGDEEDSWKRFFSGSVWKVIYKPNVLIAICLSIWFMFNCQRF